VGVDLHEGKEGDVKGEEGLGVLKETRLVGREDQRDRTATTEHGLRNNRKEGLLHTKTKKWINRAAKKKTRWGNR